MAVYRWIAENWQLMIAMSFVILILPMTGAITETLRAAKKGIKELATPTGFIVFAALAYIAYRIYLSIAVTL